jgi:hypothetical protein
MENASRGRGRFRNRATKQSTSALTDAERAGGRPPEESIVAAMRDRAKGG